MKHILITIWLCLAICLPTWSQEDLRISAAFDKKFTRREGAKEVLVKNLPVDNKKMTLFHSLALPLSAEESLEIEQLVLTDEQLALDKERGSKSGRLYYAFFRLPDKNKNIHRYIFYRNDALRKGANPITTIIYIEGSVTMTDLRKQYCK